ncbi:MAG: hypothetical protein ACW97O_06845 [Candidatus Thorarchaeota archaeon]|jgi:hypothetical protein
MPEGLFLIPSKSRELYPIVSQVYPYGDFPNICLLGSFKPNNPGIGFGVIFSFWMKPKRVLLVSENSTYI